MAQIHHPPSRASRCRLFSSGSHSKVPLLNRRPSSSTSQSDSLPEDWSCSIERIYSTRSGSEFYNTPAFEIDRVTTNTNYQDNDCPHNNTTHTNYEDSRNNNWPPYNTNLNDTFNNRNNYNRQGTINDSTLLEVLVPQSGSRPLPRTHTTAHQPTQLQPIPPRSTSLSSIPIQSAPRLPPSRSPPPLPLPASSSSNSSSPPSRTENRYQNSNHHMVKKGSCCSNGCCSCRVCAGLIMVFTFVLALGAIGMSVYFIFFTPQPKVGLRSTL